MFNNFAYIALLFIICILLLLRRILTENSKIIASRIVCACLIIFSGFRFCVGTDYNGYVDTFEKVVTQGRYYELEWGYYWLVKIVDRIGGTAQFVFLLFAFATITFIYKFIEHFSENVELSWLVFVCIGPYYVSTFNGMRQWLAVAIFAYSLRFIKENNFKKYLLFNMIGFLFHYSAIILIPFYWVLKAKGFSVFKSVIYYLVFQIFVLTGVVDRIAEELHAKSYVEGDGALTLDWAYYLFLVLSIGFIILDLVWKMFNDENVLWKNINMLSGLTVFLAITSSDLSNIIFTRFNMYFFIGYIILIPAVISKISNKFLKPIVMVSSIVLSITYYLYVTSTAKDLLPYQMSFDLFTWLRG